VGQRSPLASGAINVEIGTFTWQHWLDAHARINQCFSRFVRAIEEKQAAQALMVCLDVQEIATQMLSRGLFVECQYTA
jgi:hypothetical protein